MLNTDAVALRLGQTIQAMTKEAGFDVKLQPTEFTSALDKGDAGEYDTFQIGWSGRVDPDGDIYEFVASKGSQNIAGYKSDELDGLLNKARTTNDEAERKELYKQAVAVVNRDRPLIYLFHEKFITGREQAGGRAEGVRRRADALQGGRPGRRAEERGMRSFILRRAGAALDRPAAVEHRGLRRPARAAG